MRYHRCGLGSGAVLLRRQARSVGKVADLISGRGDLSGACSRVFRLAGSARAPVLGRVGHTFGYVGPSDLPDRCALAQSVFQSNVADAEAIRCGMDFGSGRRGDLPNEGA